MRARISKRPYRQFWMPLVVRLAEENSGELAGTLPVGAAGFEERGWGLARGGLR